MRHFTPIPAILLTLLASAVALGAADREAQLQAGYLLNFAKLVDWPETPAGTPITFCFLGGDIVHDALAMDLEQRRVGPRPVSLRHLHAVTESAGCDVLYVDGKFPTDKSAGLPTQMYLLTVGNTATFISEGGMIQLFTEKNRLRFRINIDTARRAGLNVSSSLLQLAASVEREVPR
jgi:hypothetical protein